MALLLDYVLEWKMSGTLHELWCGDNRVAAMQFNEQKGTYRAKVPLGLYDGVSEYSGEATHVEEAKHTVKWAVLGYLHKFKLTTIGSITGDYHAEARKNDG